MNNKDNAGGFLCTDEERLLISRATELSERSENSAVALSFLTPRCQRLIFEAMVREGHVGRLFLWGGYVGAERRMAIFLPSWLDPQPPAGEGAFSEERERYFVSLLSECGMLSLIAELMSCISIRRSGFAAISHRDILGSLMALGIKRSVLGDICITDDGALLFCEEKTCAFIANELKRAGRDTVRCQRAELSQDFSPERRFEEIRTTVASPRIDGSVRALCNISRDEAVSLVTGGQTEVNYFIEKEPDRHLEKGDILSVRGFGKFIIDSAEEQNRRGRIRLVARKYV